MSIKVICDLCKEELNKPGGLAFSPPETKHCQKYHICVTCWEERIKELFE